ncbi:MAG: lysylphosphatidylglycerol synthase transmembrane domain-containing protein [Alphaproteobacteria bacterium]
MTAEVGTALVTGMLFRRLMSTVIAIAVSAVVLWWLLADGTGAHLIEALATANVWLLALGALIAIAVQLVRAWRFAILATGSLALPSWTMVGIGTRLVLFNFLLPFKLGEISFPLMMKRTYGTPLGEGAGNLILCRLLDLGVVAALILVTAAWLIDPAVYGWSPALITALGLVAFVMPLLMTEWLPCLRRVTRRWPRIDRLAGQMSHGASMMRPLRPKLLVTALSLTIWLAHATIAWLVARAIGTGFGFATMAMASAASNFAFALPISGVAGLGPPQAAWASMLRMAGHDWAPAITSALLCHGLLLSTLATFGAALALGQTFRGGTIIEEHGSTSSIGGR